MFNYLPDSIVGCNTIHGLLRSLGVNRCVTRYAPSIVRGQRRGGTDGRSDECLRHVHHRTMKRDPPPGATTNVFRFTLNGNAAGRTYRSTCNCSRICGLLVAQVCSMIRS